MESSMSKLKFSDGITIDTSGPYRVISVKGGMYVVGQGCCIPVANGKEAFEIMKLFKENK